MNYLVIPHIRVQNANAQPAWWMIGPPPMTAYAGFAHALTLALGQQKCEGFGVVHHDIQFLGEQEGWAFCPHQYRAASFINKDDYSSKNRYALSAQPTARCHLVVSIVMKWPENECIDLEYTLPHFLRGGRLAGGAIIDHGKTDLFSHIEEVIAFITTGYAIHERQDLMVRQKDEHDFLDVMLRLTKKQTDAKDYPTPWLMPSALGYLAITEFKHRENVRNGLPHAFVEPLVGMIQYQNIHKDSIPIWQAIHPDPNTYLVTTASAYSPKEQP